MNKRMQRWVIKPFWIQGVFLFSFLFIVSSAVVFAQGEQKAKEGLQLILKAAKTDFVVGEAIDLQLDIQNTNLEPVTLVEPKIQEHVDNWSFVGYISAPGGRKLTAEHAQNSMLYNLKKGDFIQLKPGEKTSIEICFDSPERIGYCYGSWWFESISSDKHVLQECFSDPGEYIIKFILESRIDRYIEWIDDRGHVREVKVDAWKGKISSNEVRIRMINKSRN